MGSAALTHPAKKARIEPNLAVGVESSLDESTCGKQSDGQQREIQVGVDRSVDRVWRGSIDQDGLAGCPASGVWPAGEAGAREAREKGRKSRNEAE
jgi:hypothetical protein